MVGTTDVNVSFELAFGHAVSVLVGLAKRKKKMVNIKLSLNSSILSMYKVFKTMLIDKFVCTQNSLKT